MPPKHECVLPNALPIPALNKLSGKRIILASASPRRIEILKTFGLEPEIIPSTFEENLSKSDFPNVYEYPVATATEKAVEVYQRVLAENLDDPPDLVIAADTVVLTHETPATSDISPSLMLQSDPEILEKPTSKRDNLRMLLDLNGRTCEVVTGVTVVYPVIHAPGYNIKSIDERTVVYFAENPHRLLQAYADSGEGLDRAGGFAAQGMGGMLLRKYDGDYWNVVGFPASSFFKFLQLLIDEEDDFLDI